MKTKVCIIGGGPSGLLLSQLLHLKGIDSVILEKKSRDYVLSRVRAGVLEHGFADLMRLAGCGDRMDREGEVHDGFFIAHDDRMDRIDLFKHSGGRSVVVYGQTEITKDLYEARDRLGGKIIHNAENVQPHEIASNAPFVTYDIHGERRQVDCDYVVGADGFHGVSRSCIPKTILKEHERTYPFGWLGILSATPPVKSELVYVKHDRGFALCSMRSKSVSRYYLQVPITDRVEDWSDEAFWAELKKRLPVEVAEQLVTGPSIEKSIAPIRSFVAEPMRFGKLFLAGDAAHIVPPTGARGLNTAAADVYVLYNALVEFYINKDSSGIDSYSEKALSRVWKSQRFSWWMTSMLHTYAEATSYEASLQKAELEYLISSDAGKAALAENYTGLLFDASRGSSDIRSAA